jgi:hypothetical protein
MRRWCHCSPSGTVGRSVADSSPFSGNGGTGNGALEWRGHGRHVIVGGVTGIVAVSFETAIGPADRTRCRSAHRAVEFPVGVGFWSAYHWDDDLHRGTMRQVPAWRKIGVAGDQSGGNLHIRYIRSFPSPCHTEETLRSHLLARTRVSLRRAYVTYVRRPEGPCCVASKVECRKRPSGKVWAAGRFPGDLRRCPRRETRTSLHSSGLRGSQRTSVGGRSTALSGITPL